MLEGLITLCTIRVGKSTCLAKYGFIPETASATNLQISANADGGMPTFVQQLVVKFGQSAKDGALPLLACCFDPKTDNGDFWEPAGMFQSYGPPVKVVYDKNSLDEQQRKMLWKVSEEACGEFKI